ncbi:glycoside hydrolase family 65 protein [Clostridium ganghwense]|uniref:Glycoside hydrolase family 65 protein n=1 Tax=Clostridium ganghwense TaxID=312089 RepID=A0ABT4CU22_9CLOT|nr:glycoside hydrolase family 65 protein [Clostridium ganghwense]MCY6372557.1 glycoside hydrolase family 65 protein [Clostridium ganghwense]
MKQYLKLDEWNIIEEGFNPENNEISESIFSLGNGFMGQRANFEEEYSGNSLQGSYIAGVYFPDKTRVGWWKNGYPEYFAKVLNSTNWIGINIVIDGESLNLGECEVKNFTRILHMKEGYLERAFNAILKNGKEIRVNSKRFISMARNEIGTIKYSISPINFDGCIEITPYLDGDIINKDSNYDEKFWLEVLKGVKPYEGYVMLKTKKLDFNICSYMRFDITKNGEKLNTSIDTFQKDKYISNTAKIDCCKNDEIVVYKYVANTSSRYYDIDTLREVTEDLSLQAQNAGFQTLFEEQVKAWDEKWTHSDIIIKGDVEAQQAIRFNIFQLNQTYTGQDERLNIGPKGFTGEKYGGSTYWDTEAYCLPFYLSTAEEKVSKNLLLYRYKQLDKAIENAEKLGFTNGSALYPMVTMNGEECHNEWEITFEEIHRNGAIAYGIYNYVNYTGDKSYLGEYGLDVLVGISRFWAQRVNFSTGKNKYVMLGVTGPNEYENNVNNNWYTNTIATWTLEYTIDVINYLKENDIKRFNELENKLNISPEELENWQHIIENMYYPEDKNLGVFLQQDGYMDKEQVLVKDLDSKHLPLNQKWSWDRILRSCFIKQADVLQGLYFLEDRYNIDTVKRNFEFYEPRTVHESSLSPCIHTILASKIGNVEKAYEMYLRTARLDLDNYNNDTCDGCHTTSMAGTWMAFVQGFGGLRVKNDKLILNPLIPDQWEGYSFKVMYRGSLLKVDVTSNNIDINNETDKEVLLSIYDKNYTIKGYETLNIRR